MHGAFNSFPVFFVRTFKIFVNSSKNPVCYCYTSYEMIDQFL